MAETMLLNALEAIRRRVRLLGILHGLGIVIAVTAGLLLAVVLLDYLLNLPGAVRMVFILAALAVIGYLLAQRVVRAAMAKLGLSDVAGKLETHFPEFNDHLRSTVNFITRGTPGSDVMKERTVSHAAEMIRRVDLNEAIDKHPTIYSMLSAAGAVAVIVLLAALVPSNYRQMALARLIQPFGDAAWPKSVEIGKCIIPGKVTVGSRFDVKITLKRGTPRDVIVYYQYGNGRIEKEVMNRAADGSYGASLDARGASLGGNGQMSVWVEAGDDSTAKSTIAVLQRLAIQSVEMIVTPPPYTRIPIQPGVELAGNPRTVTYGSTIQLNVKFNKDLDASKPVTVVAATSESKTPDQLKWDALGGPTAVAHFIARQNVAFQLHATDTDGFTNSDLATMSVIVKPDEKPTVTITDPVGESDHTAVATIPMTIVAGDDFQLSSIKLIATRQGEKPQEFAPIVLETNGQLAPGVTWKLQENVDKPTWTVYFTLDLSKLDASPLNPGDKIDVRAQVKDNFDFEGQYHDPVDSNHIRFNILSQDQFTKLIEERIAAVRDRVVEAMNREKALADRTSFLKNDSAKRPEFNPGDRDQGKQLIGDQNDNASKTTELSKALEQTAKELDQNKSEATNLKDIAKDVAKELQQAAEQPMKNASAQIGSASDQKSPPPSATDQQKQDATNQRNDKLDNAVAEQKNAAEKLEQAATRMGEVGSLARRIEELKKIQADQLEVSKKSDEVGLPNMGKTPEQMKPEDRQQQQANAAQQDKLAEETDKAIQQLNQDSKKLDKKDPAAAAAMKSAAQIGQQQNVASQMKNAAQQMQQNQQSNTQQSQSQAEIGLQTMINELQQAENRKLEELIKQLADAKKQMEELVRQQATLNLNNLCLRGEDPKKILSDRLEVVVAEAQLVVDHLPPPPDLGAQTNLQEQTRHNTQSVSKVVEALPEGAAAVTQLDRAADLMSRAIVALRDEGDQAKKLTGAYDPHQVEALATLEKARDMVAEQLRKAQEQQKAAQKDSIRKQYEEILARQKTLDAGSKKLSDAHPDTHWGRIDGAPVVQLSDDQDKIAQTTSKLDQALSALDSIVYIWANKDVVDSMNVVKKDLAIPDPGPVAQAEQISVEEKLQAMIDSLKVEPIKKEMEDPKGGGGGSGSGKPPKKLPTEAELRLMKQLQEAVNKSTDAIAKLGKLDDQKVVALGGREGKLHDLLGKLLQKAKLDVPPDLGPADKLPEEVAKEDQADKELENQLLQATGDPTDDQVSAGVKMVTQRMGKVRDRLADAKDPGPVTQDIEKHIVKNLDELIQMARAQQKKSKPKPGEGDPSEGPPQPGQQPGQQPGNADSQGKPEGQSPAQSSQGNRDTDASNASSKATIADALKEWGGLSDRQRKSIAEVPNEQPIGKFKDLVDQYYRAIGMRLNNNNNNGD